ncbi:MAG: ATP-binding cassette domain-containing protein, partial [Gemmatimonadales bacterium]
MTVTSPPRPLLRLDGITKSFGERPVVDRLSFDVRPGEIFALLGPNGAGKTTVVRMLLGIIAPDEGRIESSLDGATSGRLPPARTGYLPEDRGLYREIPVLRTLVYFGQLRGLGHDEARRRALEWLERMGLLDRVDERLDALSKGNQQRVQLIAALLHRPTLAVLDEPFSGLDPLSQEFFLDLVREIRDAGTTILLSAHQMDLVERVADRVLLINRGREILNGSIGELHARIDPRPRLAIT